MLSLTRDLGQTIVFRVKGVDARYLKSGPLRLKLTEFQHWQGIFHLQARGIDEKITVVRDIPYLLKFCERHVYIHISRINRNQCTLKFDAPRDVLIDRAERM